VLAVGAVRHLVVELEAAVKLGLDVELLHRELVISTTAAATVAAERGSRLLGGATLSENGLSERTAAKITLRLVFSAGPAAEVPVVVLIETADVEVTPRPATLLLVVTLVVNGTRGRVLGGFLPVTPLEMCKYSIR
jgi:hypothetical protein